MWEEHRSLSFSLTPLHSPRMVDDKQPATEVFYIKREKMQPTKPELKKDTYTLSQLCVSRDAV